MTGSNRIQTIRLITLAVLGIDIAQNEQSTTPPVERLQLRRVRVMGTNRIELTGITEAMRDRLRAYGLFTEIISWKLRFFVPVDASGIEVLGKLFARFPVERIGRLTSCSSR